MPTATISYAGTPFCTSVGTAQSVTISGTGAYTGGTYSAPVGLSINSSTGAITPSTSTAGTYTITYTIPESGGCAAVPVTTSVTITALPVATFSYTGTPYCSNATNPSPTFSGGGVAGTFSSTAGLIFVSTSTGQINLATSTAGTYTVTNTIAASGGCAQVTATSSITITTLPAATISYSGTPFCKSVATAQAVTRTGIAGGAYTASPAGLMIDGATGAITPSTSTAGVYTVTYTIAAANGCGIVTATASATITAASTATISYAGTPFCTSVATAQSVTLSGTGAYTGGTYSSTAGLIINSSTGAITPSMSTAGTYTVTYTVPATGGCAAIPATTSVTITTLPIATFSYTGTPYCSNATNPSPTFSGGGLAGTFSSTTGLNFVSTSTGQINLASSTAGTYTVTNTIAASGGCALVSATNTITITTLPAATISYAGTPFCKSVVTAQAVTLTGTIGGAYTALPAGLTIDGGTGAITPSTSTAGTYTVTYTLAAGSGCAVVTATAPVTITAVPIATISYAGTPLCTSVATAQSVTLSGTDAYTGGTYSSTAGLIINSSTGAITPGTSTAGTYTVTYTIPLSGGCAAVPINTSVTITTLPIATFSYTGTPYCSNATNPSPTFSGGGVAGTFSSTTGLNFVSTSTGQINLATSTAGTYTVTNTIAATGGCGIVTATSSITINPNLPVTINISASDNPVCSGTSVTFTATPTNGGTTPSYQWKVNGVNAGTNSSIYSYVPVNTDAITCIVTSNATCATGNPATSNTVPMTVNPNLPVSVSIAASSNPVCSGTSVTYTATPTNGGTTPSYQWKVNGVNAGTNSSTYSYIPVNTDAITCVVTSNATCATGNPITSNTVIMTVNPNLPVSVTIAASSNPVCSGTSVTYIATPTNGGTTPSYQWKVNGVNAGTNSSTYSYVPVNTDAITCIVTSNATCATGNPATSNTVTMTVNPNLPASVSIAASATTICAGTSVTFTATPTNGGTTPTYQWYNGATLISGETNATYTSSTLANGNTITVKMTLNATCATGSPATSGAISMTVNPNLPVSVSNSASANTVCAGTSVTFTANPTNGGNTPTYQWKVNGANAGTNSSTYSYIPGNTDAITCVVTSNATCASGNPSTSNTVTMTVYSLIGNNILDNTNGNHGVLCATAAENANAVLTAPAGMVFINVGFASYGTPNGTCLAFTPGRCNASSSQSVCESYLLGKNTATIPATNGIFTDPCVGTLKKLYVQATYTQPICTGTSPGMITGSAPTGGNGSYVYLWETSTNNASSGFTPASGTNDGQDYTPGLLTQTMWYRRTVTSGGCSNISIVIQITVASGNTAGVASSTPTLCINTALTNITHATTGATGISNSGISGANGLSSGVSATWASNTITISGTPTVSGTFNYSIPLTGGCGSVNATGTITVNDKPAIAAISAPATLCAGGSLNPTAPTVTANGSAVSASGWQLETAVSSGSFANLTVPYTVVFADNEKKIQYYATNSCGTTYSNQVVVSVNPTPAITAMTTIICSEDGFSVAPLDGTNGTVPVSTTYTWAAPVISPSGTITGGGAQSTGQADIGQTLTNTTTSVATATYTVIPTSGSCPGSTFTVTVTVNPKPVIGSFN